MSTRLARIVFPPLLALLSGLEATAKAGDTCADFHISPYSFGGIAQDYSNSLVMLKSGNNSGEGFLIDSKRKLFITARHVIEASIGKDNKNNNIPILAENDEHSKFRLNIIDADSNLDVAMLQAEDIINFDNVLPVELYFDSVGASTLVTFPGLGFAHSKDVHATSPAPTTVTYDNDDGVMLLRVPTYAGDSGAPVYTDQGVVVGIVQKKQMQDQGTAMRADRLADFFLGTLMIMRRAVFAI